MIVVIPKIIGLREEVVVDSANARFLLPGEVRVRLLHILAAQVWRGFAKLVKDDFVAICVVAMFVYCERFASNGQQIGIGNVLFDFVRKWKCRHPTCGLVIVMDA